MRVVDIITRKLTEAFAPSTLAVEDESHQHIGHVGARPGGETHFHVVMVADALADLSRVEQQRAVYRVLAAEMEEQIHALRLTLNAPQ